MGDWQFLTLKLLTSSVTGVLGGSGAGTGSRCNSVVLILTFMGNCLTQSLGDSRVDPGAIQAAYSIRIIKIPSLWPFGYVENAGILGMCGM